MNINYIQKVNKMNGNHSNCYNYKNVAICATLPAQAAYVPYDAVSAKVGHCRHHSSCELVIELPTVQPITKMLWKS